MKPCSLVCILFCAVVLAAASLFAQDVIISEFLAVNDKSITDEDGAHVDWIEIYNVGGVSTNLAGWYLTRTTNDMTQWQFPSTNLPAGGFMIVFASEKDRRITGQPLHTNFKLGSGGNYLALVRPDLSVASEYAPSYPEQSGDVSYGLYTSKTWRAVEIGDGCRWTPAAAAVPGTWTNASFDDSTWSNGVSGLGFQNPLGEMYPFIQTFVSTGSAGVYARFRFVLDDTNLVSGLALRMKYDDGFTACLNGVKVAESNAPADPTWESLATADHDPGFAVVDEYYDLSAFADRLVEGTNVLSVHILNVASNSADLLCVPTIDISYSEFVTLAGYFQQPTPGSTNVEGRSGFVEDVDFNPDRGYYYAPFYLTMGNETPGCQIRYTTNGSKPTVDTGFIYSSPILVYTTCTIRAGAFRSGYASPKITTHTFLFPNDIGFQQRMNSAVRTDPVYGPQMPDSFVSLPTLSIVIKYSDMWGPSGIYDNYLAEGPAWEREASVELINPDGSEGFQLDCGIRIYGGVGRTVAKKSFRLLFKDIYGPTKLNYDLFGYGAVENFDTIILRAGFNDYVLWSGITDPFVKDTQISTGSPGCHGTHVHLYINGWYWGVYNPCERPSSSFCSAYFGGEKEDWDGINAGYTIEESDMAEWSLLAYAANAGFETLEKYMQVQGMDTNGVANPAYTNLLDVTNHSDYMLSHIWSGTGDWPSHNWYAAGRDVIPSGWKFFCWDAEFSIICCGRTLYTDVTGTTGPYPYSPLPTVGFYQKLRANPEFRLLFADRAQKHMFNDGGMTVQAVTNRWKGLMNRVEPAVVAEAGRWGAVSSIAAWSSRQIDVLNNYMPQRTAIVLNQLKSASLYPNVFAPVFSQFGGLYTNGFQLTITASNTIYYTLDGTDPRRFGYDTVVGTQYSTPLTLSGYLQVKARARTAEGVWSALTETWFVPAELPPLAISEVMYNPAPAATTNWNNDDFEFVEIRNIGTGSCSLSWVRLSGQVDHQFTNGTLTAGQYGVLVANYSAFTNRYVTNGIAILGVYTGQLGNAGGKIELSATPRGPTIASFTYGDGPDWPMDADGGGHSLVPLKMSNQVYELDYRRNWRASTYIGGSPGKADPVLDDTLVINEYAAHTDYNNPALPQYDSDDWIEIFNLAATNITVADTNWYLSDQRESLKKWQVPVGVVFTGLSWHVFNEVTNFHWPVSSGFGLNKDGEEILLSYLPGGSADRVVDAVEFKAQENGVTEGRYRDGEAYFTSLIPTPAASNRLYFREIVISEVMYNPPDDESGSDRRHQYIEIHNVGTNAVQLWNEAGTWRVGGDVSYRFPTNVTMLPDGYLLVVPFNPMDTKSLDVFLLAYGLTNGQTRIYGPFNGNLDDREGRISLERPQLPDTPGDDVSWVVVDQLIYFDRSPWYTQTDGLGQPLERLYYQGNGTDPANWAAGFGASPGLPPGRVKVLNPSSGAIYFTPYTAQAEALLHTSHIVGDARVEFFLDGASIGDDTTSPYQVSIPAISVTGEHEMKAVLTDSYRTETSPPASFICMDIDGTLGEAAVSDHSVRVNGYLYGSGGVASVYVYWGTNDGGTVEDNWDNCAVVGAMQAGPVATYLYGMEGGNWYHYRFKAATPDDSKWGADTISFFSRPAQYWQYRMRIGFGGYDRPGILTNFPVLVVLSNGIPGFSYGQFADANATDLRFTDETGKHELSFEMEHWTTTNPSLIWVSVPEFKTNSCIYAYWGNTNAVTAPDRDNGTVWADGFEGVWHYNGDLFDAALNGHRGVDFNSEDYPVGMIDGARNCNGSNACVYPTITGDWIGEHINGMTLTLWVYAVTNVTSKKCLFGSQTASSNDVFFLGSEKAPTNKWAAWRFAIQSHTNFYGNAYDREVMINHSAWTMLGVVLKDHSAQLYVNGLPAEAPLSYTDFTPGGDPLLCAMATGDGGNREYYAGRAVDEMRISDNARSPDWIWAEFMTVLSNRAFSTYETIEEIGIPAWWKELHFGDAEAAIAAEGVDADDDGMSNWEEYIAGSDPMSNTNKFMLYTGVTNNVPYVWMPTIRPGAEYIDYKRYYSLDAGTNMLAPGWSGIGGKQNIEGDNTPVTFTNITGTSVFFRGRVKME